MTQNNKLRSTVVTQRRFYDNSWKNADQSYTQTPSQNPDEAMKITSKVQATNSLRPRMTMGNKNHQDTNMAH